MRLASKFALRSLNRSFHLSPFTLFRNWAHTVTVETEAAEPVVTTAIEEQGVSAVAVIAVKRRQPVETVATSAADHRSVAIARSGEEDAVAVGTGDAVTVYAVLGGPSPSAVVEQFSLLFNCWHAPGATPFYMGHIVLGVKDGFVIHSAITAIIAILGHVIKTTATPFIGTQVVVALLLGFAPSIITTEFFRFCCTYIAGCPFYTAWQTEVNIFMTIVWVILAISTRYKER